MMCSQRMKSALLRLIRKKSSVPRPVRHVPRPMSSWVGHMAAGFFVITGPARTHLPSGHTTSDRRRILVVFTSRRRSTYIQRIYNVGLSTS